MAQSFNKETKFDGLTSTHQCRPRFTGAGRVTEGLVVAQTEVSLRCSEVSGVVGIASPFPIRIPNGRYQG